jgi:hypothetical protein
MDLTNKKMSILNLTPQNKADGELFVYSFRHVFMMILLVGVLIGYAFFINSPVASAAGGKCYDIKGKGKVVNELGVPNSGVVDFDASGVALMYQACVEDPEDDGVGPFLVKGWVWNDNLGWISMYCSGGFNLDADCGGVNYGVTISDDGRLSGQAWGDAAGWVYFNNGIHGQVRVETEDSLCQGYIYGDNKPKTACPAHTGGSKDTHAWSNNVGWMDFDGVILPWYKLVKKITPSNVKITLTPDPALARKKITVPVIGSAGYTLKVEIKDNDGLPLNESRYLTEFVVVWDKDTVKKDQTEPGVKLLNYSENCRFNDPIDIGEDYRAVSKPCWHEDFIHVTNSGIWTSAITSIAPTSNMNGLVDESDDMIFSYEKFISPSNKANIGLEPNELILKNIEISVFDEDAGVCIIGASDMCGGLQMGVNGGDTFVNFKFKPDTEFTVFSQEGLDNGLIEMSVGIEEDFYILKQGLKSTNLIAGIDDNNVNGVLKLVNNFGATFGESSWLVNKVSDFVAKIIQEPGKDAPSHFGGLYMYSVVEGSGGVKYFSNKLPRKVGSSGVQPVAVLRGNVYTTGSSKITTAVDAIRSLGDVSTNILRDQIFRNVSSIIAGAERPKWGQSLTLNSDDKGNGFKKSMGLGPIIPLMPDGEGVSKVYYARGDVHIGTVGSGDLGWTGERTIIVIGGNVYIDANLYNTGVTPKPKLGIIVLKDLASSISQGDKGHVYIHKDVTNIQANIFADGSVFSYDESHLPDANGEPLWGTLNAAAEALRYKQLLIEGSVASQNTIGGSGLTSPIKGDGTETTVDNARLYDFNYLRYYTGLLKKTADGKVDCESEIYDSESAVSAKLINNNKPWPVSQGGCLWPPKEIDGRYAAASGLTEATDLGATYIYFDPPSATLPGFAAGRGVDVQVRPR